MALEVNCETDFVAKNNIFRQLVSNVTRQIAQATPVHANQSNSKNEVISQYSIDPQQLNAFQDAVGEAVVQLGEKIRLSRALIVRTRSESEKPIRLIGYTHSAAGSNLYEQGVLVGRYATIAAFQPLLNAEAYRQLLQQPTELDEEGYEIEKPVSFEECARNVCQHIIGMKPKTVGTFEASSTESKTEQLQQQETNDAVKTEKAEEPESLLDQSFLLDDDKTVRDYVNFNQVKILDFVRIECGDVHVEQA